MGEFYRNFVRVIRFRITTYINLLDNTVLQFHTDPTNSIRPGKHPERGLLLLQLR